MKKFMNKKLLAILVVFIMCIQPTLVHAANNANASGLKMKHLTVITNAVNNANKEKAEREAKGKEHTPNETYYKAGQKFGYDAYTADGKTEGVKVLINGTELTKGNAASTVGAAYEKGVTLVLADGYYLKQYKVVCGEKYNCSITEEAVKTDANSATGTMTTATATATTTAAATITVPEAKSSIPAVNEKGEILLKFEKIAFGHSEKEETYWLLLDIGKKDDGNAAVAASSEQKDTGAGVKADTKKDGTTDTGANSEVTNNQDGAKTDNSTVAPTSEETGTPEATPTPEPTGTPETTPTPEPTGTPETTPTPEPTGTPEATPTPEPTGTPEATPTPEPTGTPEATPTPEPTTTPEPISTKDYTVGITWKDEDNQDGVRPAEVKIQLYADGKASGEAIALKSENSWKYTYKDLPTKASAEAEKEIVYTAKAVTVPDKYTETITTAGTEVKITYSHVVAKVDIPVRIAFSDSNNQDGIRPTEVKVQLYADNKAVGDAVKLVSTEQWKLSFEDYDAYAAGKKITYTVKAVDVAKGYTASVKNTNGEWVVTCTHTPEKISVTINVKWDDDNNKTKERPTEVKLQLYANGTKQGSAVTVKSSASWKYTYSNLAKYKDGKEITYTVKQVNLSSKYKEYVKGYTITNVIATKVAAKTADHANWGIWIGIMAVSILCIGEIVNYKRRRNLF